PLADAEKVGVAFAKEAGASSLAALRAMPAQQVMEAAVKGNPFRFASTVDSYLLPKLPVEILASGEQAHVPLLVGWNSDEMNYRSVLGLDEPNAENYGKAVRRLY